VDEICMPVKAYYGHVMALKDQVDLLFLPRLVSVETKAYICPKFMGLPDMIRSNVPDLPTLINVTINATEGARAFSRAIYEMGSYFCSSSRKIRKAWEEASRYQHKFTELKKRGFLPHEAIKYLEDGLGKLHGADSRSVRIALMGHGYTIYDEHLSMNIIEHLRNMGAEVITPDNLPLELTEEEAAKLPKRMFWTLGKRLLGGTLHYLQRFDIDGILYVTVFGCGPDSMIADLAERFVRRQGRIPFLMLTLDEHTGEAGVLTRLEAFMDMLSWRAENESNLSPYGKSLDSR